MVVLDNEMKKEKTGTTEATDGSATRKLAVKTDSGMKKEEMGTVETTLRT